VDTIDANHTFERVVQNNISILNKLLCILDKEARSRFNDEYQNIFKESKFWKLLLSDGNGVRREMYRLISLLCDLDHDYLDMALSHVGTIWMPKIFTETNGNNQADLWDCLVNLSKIRPQLWSLGSQKKPIISKYLKFLSTGCHGLGQAVYPCQLVIFSLLPSEVIGEGFAKDFLDACWKGFFCKSIHNDSLEFSQMILEVGWYCIVQCPKDSSGTFDFVNLGLVNPLLSTFQQEVRFTTYS